ncbi:type II secretion system GspH family protein [Neiella marina]|uniref:Type II secretion system GspH family protein n=1 Tax=Neiella holothuriorum TaxID=2870530 RepID=A0ABS7EHT8_9GAMM|nr:type II secretion system protein [Neiella holothuriorum]MBW8191919.1 type II secretion system GspH family protein [Neiella holothuriorum]
MNKQRGFTLIELVVVIVILGILAVTASPRFIDISSDARASTLQGLKGALQSGADLVYSKSVINGVETGSDELDIDGDGVDDILVRSGYPRVANNCTRFISDMDYWVDLKIEASCQSDTNAEWYGVVESNMFHYMPMGYTTTDENCFVTYTTASEFDGSSWVDAAGPIILIETDGC